MLIKKPSDIRSSEITNKNLYLNRRKFILGAAAALAGWGAGGSSLLAFPEEASAGVKLNGVRKSGFSASETPNSLKDVAGYNNFYEFGTDKYSPAQNAKTLVPRPWTVVVDGEVKRARRFDIDELMKVGPLEDRIYRLRCVEGWSMVIPWIGFSLASLIKQAEPTSSSRDRPEVGRLFFF